MKHQSSNKLLDKIQIATNLQQAVAQLPICTQVGNGVENYQFCPLMEKVNIIVKDLVPGTLTNPDTMPLFVTLDKNLASDVGVSLSFQGVTLLSSSFLNSSLGELMDKYGTDILKDKLSITDYTPEVAAIIKQYVASFKASSTI